MTSVTSAIHLSHGGNHWGGKAVAPVRCEALGPRATSWFLSVRRCELTEQTDPTRPAVSEPKLQGQF